MCHTQVEYGVDVAIESAFLDGDAAVEDSLGGGIPLVSVLATVRCSVAFVRVRASESWVLCGRLFFEFCFGS